MPLPDRGRCRGPSSRIARPAGRTGAARRETGRRRGGCWGHDLTRPATRAAARAERTTRRTRQHRRGTASYDAVAWWHRACTVATAAMPPGVRAGLPLTAGACRDTSTARSARTRRCAVPRAPARGGLVHTTVPFIAVDRVPSSPAAATHWALPEGARRVHRRRVDAGQSATADLVGRGTRAARQRPPLAARFATTQVGRAQPPSSTRPRRGPASSGSSLAGVSPARLGRPRSASPASCSPARGSWSAPARRAAAPRSRPRPCSTWCRCCSPRWCSSTSGCGCSVSRCW